MIPQPNNLVLGTVQLGMKYGLGNTHGQPTKEESFGILDAALATGITMFDTAWSYGTAEDVLGAWIKERSLADTVRVISKMKPHALNDYPDGTKAEDVVHRELEKSLSRLGVTILDGYLFHSPYYIYLTHLVEGMRKVKGEGLVKNIGVSTYNETEALQAVELGVDYVQVPYNVFDQRLNKTKFFDLAKKNGVTVFARSPFLQGLLLMQPADLPAHLAYLRPHLEAFLEITRRYAVTPLEACLAFTRATCPGAMVVFGVDTKEQFSKDVIAVRQNPTNGFVDELTAAFGALNHGAINPSLWSLIKQ